MSWLTGRTIALSVSAPENLAQYGMGPEHLDDAMGEITRQLLALGARLMYGGDLRAGGITRMLFEIAARYYPPSARNADYAPAIIDVIPYYAHAELRSEDLQAWAGEFAGTGELRFMTRGGDRAWNQRERPGNLVPLARDDWAAALTAMRTYVTQNSDARVVVGGKTTGYMGRMPGISEEALTSVEAHKPLFVIGGFGGAARSIARSLVANEPVQFPGIERGFDDVAPNGLEVEELSRLAMSPHIDEIVVLITRGLRRLFAG